MPLLTISKIKGSVKIFLNEDLLKKLPQTKKTNANFNTEDKANESSN